MKTFSPVSWMRMAFAAAATAVLATSPAWAGKYASIVIDLDSHKVLHARDADETRYPASLTKVMTLYLVFDALDSGKLKLNERITVSRAASRQQPSKLGLKAGATIKVEDAIRALVTKSANDVAVVLAEKLGGGAESKFVVKMNAKAKELGLDNTNFMNASGLPNRKQTTTARDMAKLAEAMFLDHKDRYNYFSLPSFTWNKRRYENHNELLKKVAGVDGIKTGYTNASGYNLMASAVRDGHRVIAVMLGGTSGRSRDQHVADLLEAAFLEINGTPMAGLSDPRQRIAYGEGGSTQADSLAMAQLRRFSGDATLVSDKDPTLVAEADDDAGTTEEGDEDGEAVAEGDDDGAVQAAADAAAKAPAATPVPPALIAAATPAPLAVVAAAETTPAAVLAQPAVATAAPALVVPAVAQPLAPAPVPAFSLPPAAAPALEGVTVTSEYVPGGPGIADPAANLQLH